MAPAIEGCPETHGECPCADRSQPSWSSDLSRHPPSSFLGCGRHWRIPLAGDSSVKHDRPPPITPAQTVRSPWNSAQVFPGQGDLSEAPGWLAAQTTDEKAPVGSTWSFDCHLPHEPQSAPLRQPRPRPIAVTAAQRRSQHVTPTSPIHTRAAAREELFRGGGREARTRRKEVEKRWAVFSASDFTSPPRRY